MKKNIRSVLVGVFTFIILLTVYIIVDKLNGEIDNLIEILIYGASAALAAYCANKLLPIDK
ncbi:MAG: hypothetical protein ACRC68_15935 [Clostridium sp.]